MQHILKQTTLLTGILSLSSCFNPYQTDFECPIGEGEKCASLSRVNDLADEGKYENSRKRKSEPKGQEINSQISSNEQPALNDGDSNVTAAKTNSEKTKPFVIYPGTNMKMEGHYV